jgi:hypothetical protein
MIQFLNIYKQKNKKGIDSDSGAGNRKDSLNEDKSSEEDIKGKNDEKKKKTKKVDIKQYKDPEGLTPFKMSLGLWLVQNKPLFKLFVYVILIIISVITWSRFLYVYGEYIIFGMRYDQEIIFDLSQRLIPDHSYFVELMPNDIKLGKVQVLKIADQKYDIFVQINNPNEQYYCSVEYHFAADNKEFGSSTAFLLPNDSKYLYTLAKEFNKNPTSFQIIIDSLGWSRIDKKRIPDWQSFKDNHINTKFSNIKFTPANETGLSEKENLSTLEFQVKNDTVYNYWEIDFVILLKNREKIIGINRYKQYNFLAEKSYDIDMTIAGVIGYVTDIIIYPELDIMNNELYIDYGDDPANRK